MVASVPDSPFLRHRSLTSENQNECMALMQQLEKLGSESRISNVLRKHGAQDPIFGVKIEEMQKITQAA